MENFQDLIDTAVVAVAESERAKKLESETASLIPKKDGLVIPGSPEFKLWRLSRAEYVEARRAGEAALKDVADAIKKAAFDLLN